MAETHPAPPTPPQTRVPVLVAGTGFGMDLVDDGPRRHEAFYETGESLRDAVVLRVRRSLAMGEEEKKMLTSTISRLETYCIASPDIDSCLVVSSSTSHSPSPMGIPMKAHRMRSQWCSRLGAWSSMYTSCLAECEFEPNCSLRFSITHRW